MKKILLIMLSFVMLMANVPAAYAERELVGTTAVKDNMLFLNGTSIPAAQLPNEFVYLSVEQLQYYGFDVSLDETDGKRTYTVARNEGKGVSANEVPSDEESVNVYTTDAEVYIDSDIPANVFELENGTVLVQSDELAKYGSYYWDPETHTISIDFKDSSELPPYQTFHDAIGVNDKSAIKRGVIVNSADQKCAVIDQEDLEKWLEPYWDFHYDRVIAPLEAFELGDKYVKLWDDGGSYTVYSSGGIIAGKYGKPYERDGVTKQNYVWYMPAISNSRNALYTANTELEYTYFYQTYEGYKNREKPLTEAEAPEIPSENMLVTDTASEWARPEIEKAAACNLMVYDLSAKYTQPITRYEFCRLAYRLIATEFQPDTDSRVGIETAMNDIVSERGLTGAFDNKFTDCYYTEAEVLSSMGIIQGVGDGVFAPDEYITREQAAAIIYRIAEFLGNKTLIKPSGDKMYDDEEKISSWAVSAVESMKAMGIMKGVNEREFAPQGTYTTEQAIAVMLRLYSCN